MSESFILEIITQFQSLIRDVESEVRIVAARNLYTFCEALPDPAENRKNLTVQHIIPYLKDLAIGECIQSLTKLSFL